MKGHILVVFPHPDDEAFGVAGTVALARKIGTPVTYVCGTLGEMGRNMGRPLFANRETLPQIRKNELEEVARVLDIQDLRMLGLRDKTLEFLDEEEFAGKIKAIIDDVKPTYIITHYPGYAVHPDHNATGAAVVRAVSKMKESERPVVLAHAFSNGCREVLGEPDVVISIDEVKDTKIAALQAHRSQIEGMIGSIKTEDLLNSPFVTRLLEKEEFWTYRFK
ncbi:bacillithiol biosynthesis deacetylase BshB2 [Priestia abyssalis]|uniref:bacillithiol biosynthesis deacetylase BshB2 n=1 Tax=Priestia abyssalis TaxID=1221450 RepID=UPI000995C224|nr:bacillithiol biosynthesis deacetylase BshB2 [Priestia abyssalis]